jgi:hypothetical protein
MVTSFTVYKLVRADSRHQDSIAMLRPQGPLVYNYKHQRITVIRKVNQRHHRAHLITTHTTQRIGRTRIPIALILNALLCHHD